MILCLLTLILFDAMLFPIQSTHDTIHVIIFLYSQLAFIDHRISGLEPILTPGQLLFVVASYFFPIASSSYVISGSPKRQKDDDGSYSSTTSTNSLREAHNSSCSYALSTSYSSEPVCGSHKKTL